MIVFVGVLVVLIWILPIYALDLGNTTTNQSINTEQFQGTFLHSNVSQNLYNPISTLESTSVGKYKDLQDLHFKILEILKGMRLPGLRNCSSYNVICYERLENESAELKSMRSKLIRC